MNRSQRSRWRIAFSVAAVVGLSQSPARAILIAYDNFNSYVVSSSITNTSDTNGGSGWFGAWGTGSQTANITRTVENPVFTGLDNGAIATITSNPNATNLLFRQISTPQSGTFYVGMKMRTSLTNPSTNDFLQFYFNATTAATDGAGYGGGVTRNTTSGAPGVYFVRRGSNASPASAAGQTVNSSLSHTYGQDTVLIFKIAKSAGGEADPYDLVSLHVNQSSEGTADAALSGTNGSSSVNISSIDTFHIRYGGSSSASTQITTLGLDDIAFASSYSDAYNFATTGIAPTGLAGDFNHDNHVDSGDYAVWRKGLGTTFTPDDYNTWRAHFGESMGSGSLGGGAVPEPSFVACVLVVCAALGCQFRQWIRTRT